MSSKLDSKYQEFGVSRRDDQIFVKMPRSKARALVMVWDLTPQGRGGPERIQALMNLLTEEEAASAEYGLRSVFYQVPATECQKDLDALVTLAENDATGVVHLFREALQAGLNNELEVDWILRVGGPGKKPPAILEREGTPANRELFLTDLGPEEDLQSRG